MPKNFLKAIILPGALIAKVRPTVHLTAMNLLSVKRRKFIRSFVYFIPITHPALSKPLHRHSLFYPHYSQTLLPYGDKLRENIEDYYRLTKSPAWLQQKDLSTLQRNSEYLYQQPLTKEQSQYLDALQKEIKPQIQKTSLKEHLLTWAWDYYHAQEWAQTLYILQTYPQDGLSERWSLRIALMQATAFYHLDQFSDIIDAINRAYAINAKTVENYLQQPENSHLQKSYYTQSLEALQQQQQPKMKTVFVSVLQYGQPKQIYIQEWDFNQWTCHYWALIKHKNS